MTIRAKAEAVVAIIVLIGIALGFRDWLSEHDARLKAEADSKASQQFVAANQQQIASLAAAIQQVREDNAKQVAALSQSIAALKTPADQMAWIIAQLKTSQPISVNVPKDPTQAATATVPQSDIPQILDQVRACEQCKLDLAAKTQELTYAQEQTRRLADSLKAMTADRDEWKATAQGGTRWQRFARAARWFVLGAAAGAIAAAAHH